MGLSAVGFRSSCIGCALDVRVAAVELPLAYISPKLKENAPLRTSGPYRFVRHPMYLALMIFCSAYVLNDFSIYGIALWLALLLILGIKVHYEERILRTRFPDYPAYAKKTKRIIPFVF